MGGYVLIFIYREKKINDKNLILDFSHADEIVNQLHVDSILSRSGHYILSVLVHQRIAEPCIARILNACTVHFGGSTHDLGDMGYITDPETAC